MPINPPAPPPSPCRALPLAVLLFSTAAMASSPSLLQLRHHLTTSRALRSSPSALALRLHISRTQLRFFSRKSSVAMAPPRSPMTTWLPGGSRGEFRFRAAKTEETTTQEGTARNQNAGEKGRTKLMLVSDLDGTMVDYKDRAHGSLLRFNNLWAAEYAHDSLLVFSTGRSLEKYTELRSQAPLLTPALCIFSVGTEIRYGATMESDQDWEQYLNEGWDQAVVLEEVRRLNVRLQDESEIRPHKVSCQIDKKDATEVIDTLSKRLKDRGLNVKIIFSHGIDLDVLPKGAGKGEALAFLLHKMKTEGWAPRETLVCGDSGNDIELFEVEGVNGVIVGGAMEELRQWYEENGKDKDKVYQAKARCAGGIVEALEKLSLGPHLSPRDRMNSNGILASENAQPARSGYAQREIVEFNTFFEKWMNGEVPSDSETFQRLTSVIAPGSTMVYPWGVEKSLLESVSTAQSKHGVTKDNKFRTWIDCIQEQKLGDGVYMVTWHAWQTSEGSERQGYFATAILREKEGTPNGLEWLRVHETSRKS